MPVIETNIGLPYVNFCKYVGAEMINNKRYWSANFIKVRYCWLSNRKRRHKQFAVLRQKSHAARDASIFLAVHDACPPASRASNPRLTTSRRDAPTQCSHVAESMLGRMRRLVKRGMNRIGHKSLLLHTFSPTALTRTLLPISPEIRPLLPSGSVVPI